MNLTNLKTSVSSIEWSRINGSGINHLSRDKYSPFQEYSCTIVSPFVLFFSLFFFARSHQSIFGIFFFSPFFKSLKSLSNREPFPPIPSIQRQCLYKVFRNSEGKVKRKNNGSCSGRRISNSSTCKQMNIFEQRSFLPSL